MQNLSPELMGRKASETFMDYAEPFLKHMMSDGSISTPHQIEVTLRLPCCVWNAVIMDAKDSENKFIELLINSMPAYGKNMVAYLKERKEMHFSQYNYLIGEYSVYFDEKYNELRLRVKAKSLS